MLTKVEVRNVAGGLMVLPLEDITEGLLVLDIQGLDPVKATIVSSSFATIDGEQHQSSRRGVRNLIFRLGLEPDYATDTVSSLRSRVYSYFMPKSFINLRFFTVDDLEVDISGHVESCETPMFTEEPTVDISILCMDPDFYDRVPVVVEGDTVDDDAEQLVEYVGSVDSGIVFTLNVDRTIDELTIYHKAPNDEIRILEFSAPMVAGDVLRISTVTGAKGATLTHLGTSSSILRGVSPQSPWTELMSGDNYIRVYAEGDPIPYTIEYLNRYGGL